MLLRTAGRIQPENNAPGRNYFSSFSRTTIYSRRVEKSIKKGAKWGGELRKHFSKERCSQTAMPFFAVFELYFGLFLSPVQNQMHR